MTRTQDDEQAVKIYRSLALTAAVVFTAVGVVRRLIDPATADPIWERAAMALILLAFVALTLLEGPVKRNPHRSVGVLLYGVSAVVIHMAWVNGFSVNTSYGLLIMLFACSLAFRSRAALAGYLVLAMSGIGIMVVRAPTLEFDPLFFMSMVVAVSMLTYAVQAKRMAADTALRHARDLAEAAVDARGRFLANMSHEIRTPMNGIIGMASLLDGTDLTASQRDYLRTIRVSGDALLMLINDILDFSKIEAGRVELECQPFDPVECVEGAVDLVTPSAREKGLELVCECAPSLPAELLGDSLRLRQVLVNLLSNAVKFTLEGEIHVHITGDSEGDAGLRLHCAVSDTGIGIAPDRVDTLFEAFVQEDSSTTRRFGGTGLGLSICKLLVEQMGGSIAVTARPGAGSRFAFDILLQLQSQSQRYSRALQSQRQSWSPPGPAARCAGRVLVFEPNPTVREAIRRQLDGWHMGNDGAASAAEAQGALSRRSYHTVLAGCSRETIAALEAGPATDERPVFIRLAPMAEVPGDGCNDAAGQTLYRPVRRAQLQRMLLPSPGGHRGNARMPDAADGRAGLAPGAAAAHGLRILLAEDNPVNQRVTLKMLERLGHHPDLAPDGRQAVEAVRHRRYDLVLMDLQMPVMDGLEATRLIRKEPGGAGVPIVAMTANAMHGDRDACLRAGMNDYLCKPVKISDLQSLLARLAFQDEAAKNTSSVMSSSISKNECTSVART